MPEEKLPDRIQNEESKTLRPVNEEAEKWLYRPIKCLDFGFVYLVDYLGSDAAIAQAARVSYGKGTKKVSDDEALIWYLMDNEHTTPFEMCELKFHAKMPIFVARQWVRHRTASINEVSRRYSEVSEEFYLPQVGDLRKQSRENRQGREDELSAENQAKVLAILQEQYRQQLSGYREFTEMELARELARIHISVANYTEWYWKIDLRNLFNFLRLRIDKHAQYEIRVYAEAMARIVKDMFPMAYGAFEEFQLNADKFSATEKKILRLARSRIRMDEDDMEELAFKFLKNKRRTKKFLEKWKSIFK